MPSEVLENILLYHAISLANFRLTQVAVWAPSRVNVFGLHPKKYHAMEFIRVLTLETTRHFMTRSDCESKPKQNTEIRAENG